MLEIRALVCAASVVMPAWAPVNEIALPPRALIAIAVSAMLVCSPVDKSTSISRSVGWSESLAASSIRLLVTPDIAETTATTCLPSRCVLRMRAATLPMRSAVPTEVPPYFWTMMGIGSCEGGCLVGLDEFADGCRVGREFVADRRLGLGFL